MTKTDAVLQWLKTHASISSMEAIENFGATRLSAIIFQLRRKGYKIETVWDVTTDRFGNRCRFGRYYMKDVL